MSLSNVLYVNIISNTGSIWRDVVSSKDRDLLDLFFCHFYEERNEVCRDPFGVFSEKT